MTTQATPDLVITACTGVVLVRDEVHSGRLVIFSACPQYFFPHGNLILVPFCPPSVAASHSEGRNSNKVMEQSPKLRAYQLKKRHVNRYWYPKISRGFHTSLWETCYKGHKPVSSKASNLGEWKCWWEITWLIKTQGISREGAEHWLSYVLQTLSASQEQTCKVP